MNCAFIGNCRMSQSYVKASFLVQCSYNFVRNVLVFDQKWLFFCSEKSLPIFMSVIFFVILLELDVKELDNPPSPPLYPYIGLKNHYPTLLSCDEQTKLDEEKIMIFFLSNEKPGINEYRFIRFHHHLRTKFFSTISLDPPGFHWSPNK